MIVHWLSDAKEWTRARLMAVARWLVWSPWRIGATVALVAVLLILAAQLRTGDSTSAAPEPDTGESSWPVATAGPRNDDDTTAGRGSPAATEPTEGTTAPDDESGTPEQGPGGHDHGVDSDDEARIRNTSEKLAREFATAFLDSKTPKRQWVKRLQPLTTPALGEAMGTVDPRNVPAGKVTGAEATYVGQFRAVVTVESSVGSMIVEVSFDGNEWLVTRYTPPEEA